MVSSRTMDQFHSNLCTGLFDTVPMGDKAGLKRHLLILQEKHKQATFYCISSTGILVFQQATVQREIRWNLLMPYRNVDEAGYLWPTAILLISA